jgi:hypothetical protein
MFLKDCESLRGHGCNFVGMIVLLRSREVPIPGIIFEAKENEMAQILDKIDFKASNEWLKHFKNLITTF